MEMAAHLAGEVNADEIDGAGGTPNKTKTKNVHKNRLTLTIDALSRYIYDCVCVCFISMYYD